MTLLVFNPSIRHLSQFHLTLWAKLFEDGLRKPRVLSARFELRHESLKIISVQ